MANPASVDDLADRWRPLSAQEQTNGETFLEDAWRNLKRKITGLEALIAADSAEDEPTDLEGEVIRVLCAAVLRVMKNPDGKRQESIDDYSWTRDQAVSAGLLYFTDEEINDLVGGANPHGRAYSVDLLAGWSAP